jgi:hypothetical protein
MTCGDITNQAPRCHKRKFRRPIFFKFSVSYSPSVKYRMKTRCKHQHVTKKVTVKGKVVPVLN